MRKFILGTDWCCDCDDAVAMRVLARAVKDNKIELCGIGINTCFADAVASLDGFLTKEGISTLIGIDRNAEGENDVHRYQARLAKYASRYKSNDEADDAVRLYRRILAGADEPVEIVEIGFTQVIADVLESKGDDISPKSGEELFREKVKKVWMMAGKWDEDGGCEFNFAHTSATRQGAEIFCRKCPVPVTFLGFEVGESVVTGSKLKDGDHLRDALCDHGSNSGRSSWDPMLCTLAVIGDEDAAGYDTVRGYATVDSDTGRNHFKSDESGLHSYVVKKYNDDFYKNMIDEIIG